MRRAEVHELIGHLQPLLDRQQLAQWAGQALQGLLANPATGAQVPDLADFAAEAWNLAEAMLAERDRRAREWDAEQRGESLFGDRAP